MSKIPPSPCPSCGDILDAATATEANTTPKPGDITICLRCGHLMAFDDDMRIRNLTDAEIKAVAGDPLILRVQRARGEVMRKRRS